MKRKEISKKVVPTAILLTELESLKVYGGKGGGIDPLGNTYCGGANCQCTDPDPGKQPDNTYCGESTNCKC